MTETTDTIEAPKLAITAIAERFRSLLFYDPETGIFTNRVNRGKHRSKGKQAGYVTAVGYVLLSVDNRRFYGHRAAWLMTYGRWPNNQIDHINGNRSDNRIANLRDVRHQVNMQNIRAAFRTNRSGCLGVYLDKRRRKYVSQIVVNDRHIYLGQFDSAALAHSAYVEAKRAHHQGGTL